MGDKVGYVPLFYSVREGGSNMVRVPRIGGHMGRRKTTVQSDNRSVGQMVHDLLDAMRESVGDGKCKELNDDQKTYVDLLVESLQRFYKDDAEELFNLNKAVGIARRVRVGQIQLPYVWAAA